VRQRRWNRPTSRWFGQNLHDEVPLVWKDVRLSESACISPDYCDNLSIEVFAKLLGVTRAHLHDACARSARCTPLKLIHDRLLEEARLRLEKTEFPVEQIAYGLGFRDPGYFNRFFKRLPGVAPGTYRQTIAMARSTNEAPSFAAWP
jgi:AraC-like DNA-binding protein